MFSKRSRTLLFICVGAAAVGLGIYTFQILFTEGLSTRKGTYAYYLTIRSSTIKGLPQIRRAGEEEYYYTPLDGTKRMANGISYLTAEPPQALVGPLDQYLKSRGFRKDEARSNDDNYFYEGAGSSFELIIKPAERGLYRVIGTEYYSD